METTHFRLAAIGLLLVGFLVVLTVPAQVQASVYGTTSNQSIENAKQPTGGTLPLSAGELSIAFQNESGSDTQYADTTSVVSTTVDTGFDISSVSFPTDGNVNAGDSRVAKYIVANRGNNSNPIPFKLRHLDFSDSDNENPSFTLELFHRDGDVSFDTNSATKVTGSSGTVNFAEGDTKSVFAVISPKDSSSPGDTIRSASFVTDQAPISNGDPATAGDQWERGKPIGTEDSFDTQTGNFLTTLQGSNLKVKKSLNLVGGSARPGDTVEYTITAWNDGNQPADTVTLVDAIPDSTSYVVNSANEINDGGNTDGSHSGNANTFVGFDFDFDPNSGDEVASDGGLSANSEGVDPSVVSIFWPLDQIQTKVNGDGANPGDQDTVQFSYQVLID